MQKFPLNIDKLSKIICSFLHLINENSIVNIDYEEKIYFHDIYLKDNLLIEIHMPEGFS